PIRVEYVRPEARVPRLSVQWQRDPGGPLVALGASDLRWREDAGDGALSTAIGVAADASFALMLIAWLALALSALATRRRALTFGEDVWRAGLGLVPILFLVHGMLLHAPLIGRATILSGLDDWLIYESSARDILLNGLRMDGGQAHAAPFYGQPLYPYVLAVAHRITGESLFGPIALQFAGLGLVVVGTAVLAR